MAALSIDQVKAKLAEYPNWDLNDDNTKLYTVVETESFHDAIDLMNEVADIAEDMEHYPDLMVFDGKFLQVLTSTHDVEGFTERDFEFIDEVDEMFDEGVDIEVDSEEDVD